MRHLDKPFDDVGLMAAVGALSRAGRPVVNSTRGRRLRAKSGITVAVKGSSYARSPFRSADKHPHLPDGGLVSPIVMYGASVVIREEARYSVVGA